MHLFSLPDMNELRRFNRKMQLPAIFTPRIPGLTCDKSSFCVLPRARAACQQNDCCEGAAMREERRPMPLNELDIKPSNRYKKVEVFKGTQSQGHFTRLHRKAPGHQKRPFHIYFQPTLAQALNLYKGGQCGCIF